MSLHFQYTYAANDQIGDRSEVLSLERKFRENTALREKMYKLEIKDAQKEIDFASGRCKEFENKLDDNQIYFDYWLRFLCDAKKSMASLPDQHETQRQDAQEEIDFASGRCKECKRKRNENQIHFDYWLRFLRDAEKSMESLPDQHETQRQEELKEYYARHFEIDPEKHRINQPDHSAIQFEAGPGWNVWDGPTHEESCSSHATRHAPRPKKEDHHTRHNENLNTERWD
jgi:hypothetical protein